VGRPSLRKDVNTLESDQSKMTRMVEKCRGEDYEERLRMSNLRNLEIRATKADM